MNLSRRHWLGGTAAALVLAPSLSAQGNADEPDWIDAHSHIWTRDVAAFPLAPGKTVEDLEPASFTAEELIDLAQQHGVGRVVLIQHHPYHGWDNSYVLSAAERYPDRFRVVAMVDNYAPQPGQVMRDLLQRKVTGFRIHPGLYKQRWLGGGMNQMWRTAAETRQNMCCLIDPQYLGEVDAMCARHPDTPVVIDHFARIGVDGQIRQQDLDVLCRLARHRHTCVKISAFYALGAKEPPYLDLAPMIRRVLDAFGPERLMWASDCPYQLVGEHTYAASIELIRERLDFLTDADRQWLLRDTAARVFFSA